MTAMMGSMQALDSATQRMALIKNKVTVQISHEASKPDWTGFQCSGAMLHLPCVAQTW